MVDIWGDDLCDMSPEAELAIMIAFVATFVLALCSFKCIIWYKKMKDVQKNNQHLYCENIKLKKRIKYRKDEQDAEANAQLHEKLQGKSGQEKDFIAREFLMNRIAKQEQEKMNIELQQKRETTHFNEMMQHKPHYEKEAIMQMRNQEYVEKRKRAKIVDDKLDELIERNEKMENEKIPSQSPVTVQVRCSGGYVNPLTHMDTY